MPFYLVLVVLIRFVEELVGERLFVEVVMVEEEAVVFLAYVDKNDDVNHGHGIGQPV